MAMNSPSRTVRYSVPLRCAPSECSFTLAAETSASTHSRVSRLRNTFGRMTTRRFTDQARSSAAGSEPWVMTCPIFDGIGMINGS